MEEAKGAISSSRALVSRRRNTCMNVVRFVIPYQPQNQRHNRPALQQDTKSLHEGARAPLLETRVVVHHHSDNCNHGHDIIALASSFPASSSSNGGLLAVHGGATHLLACLLDLVQHGGVLERGLGHDVGRLVLERDVVRLDACRGVSKEGLLSCRGNMICKGGSSATHRRAS